LRIKVKPNFVNNFLDPFNPQFAEQKNENEEQKEYEPICDLYDPMVTKAFGENCINIQLQTPKTGILKLINPNPIFHAYIKIDQNTTKFCFK
jgi:hypothetical protein